ncbi:hypothetical protein DFH09DRAFT_1499666, partial [Mycena vulgaris]
MGTSIARTLLSLTTAPAYRRSPFLHHPRALLLAAGALTLIALAVVLGPTVGQGLQVLVPESFAEYCYGPPPPPPPPPPSSDAHSPPSTPPSSLPAPAADSDAALITSRPPPHGFDAFYASAREPNCLIDAYDGVHADFVPFWQVERRGPGVVSEAVAERLKKDPRGMTALSIRDGEVHRPDYRGTYFDGDWERTINKLTATGKETRRRLSLPAVPDEWQGGAPQASSSSGAVGLLFCRAHGEP